jgi:hypothetical protein
MTWFFAERGSIVRVKRIAYMKSPCHHHKVLQDLSPGAAPSEAGLPFLD